MSLIKWPKEVGGDVPLRSVLMQISEFTLRIESWKPSSWIKRAAHLAASNSSMITEDGFGIFSDRATIISPWEFQTTTAIPASFSSSNMALSKFAFALPASGSFQIFFAGRAFLGALLWNLWNFAKWSQAKKAIMSRGIMSWWTWTLFLLFQINQHFMANQAILLGVLSTSPKKSTKEWSW